ncbi:adenosine deaminase [Lactobacillus sp. ESL0791]|uniref:adenosine deaminase n=1 Tax=Lactobacillus sp. ESL0791 TaxID=2983234 RepID=UPI0023F86740|nr:adenosine deaminase [Lactobacillus sp. ESL0791]MDF7638671.1 adenosine deaminase [Lactobacillus sp. ESL0791]
METDLKEFIAGLPKAELHVHVEGTLEPDLEFACAQRNHIDIGAKTVSDIDHSYGYGLEEFLKAYYTGMKVLRTEQDFYDLTWAYLQKMAHSSVKHVELFFDPQAHTSRGVSFAAVITGIHRAIVDARALGVDTQLIMCFLRDFSKESAWQTLLAAEPYREKGWLTGVGLDSAEHHNPPLKFMLVFAKAKSLGYQLTMHCDPRQVDSVAHIKEALEVIEVDRLDHGTNITEDPDLLDYLLKQDLGITVCPIAYYYTRQNMELTAIKELFARGAKVSLNSDDPAYKGDTYINDVYYRFAQEAHWGKDELAQIAKNSFTSSWLSVEAKKAYLKQVDDYVKANN